MAAVGVLLRAHDCQSVLHHGLVGRLDFLVDHPYITFDLYLCLLGKRVCLKILLNIPHSGLGVVIFL